MGMGFPLFNQLLVWGSVRGLGQSPLAARNGFSDFQASQNSSHCDVCRKLTSCQKTFVNRKTTAFDHLGEEFDRHHYLPPSLWTP